MADAPDAPKARETADQPEPSTTRTGTRRPEIDIVKARNLLAQLVSAVFIVLALVMAGAALVIALKANESNGFVEFIKNFAQNIDLGIFSLENPIKEFKDDPNMIKTALLSYGLGAVFYLIVGRILDRVIRP